MPYIVNSSPGPGLRFEPSSLQPDANAAMVCAEGLERRGMRLIRIRDTDTGEIFDQAALRQECKRLQALA